MPRSLLASLCALALLSGCTSTRQWAASRSAPDELARVTATFADRDVSVRMILETDRGRFIEARPDSTRWVRRDGTLRAVPTSEVRSLFIDDGAGRALGGAALGTVAGIALVADAVDRLDDEDANVGDALALGFTAFVITPILISVGLATGASMGNSLTVWIRP